jgi:hypothetical protein
MVADVRLTGQFMTADFQIGSDGAHGTLVVHV